MVKEVHVIIKDDGSAVVSCKGVDSPFEVMGILDYAKRMTFVQTGQKQAKKEAAQNIGSGNTAPNNANGGSPEGSTQP
jgi:hypothetical protein